MASKFPDFLFPIWHRGPSIVEVTPAAWHKHPLADCLPSQCWHRHFPSLLRRLIFMYFYCNYMAEILGFQQALVFFFSFPPAGAFHPRLQIELSDCQLFPKPWRIKPNSKQKIKKKKRPDGSWRASKINTMIGAVEWWRESVRLSSDAGCPCQNLLIIEGRNVFCFVFASVFQCLCVFRGF